MKSLRAEAALVIHAICYEGVSLNEALASHPTQSKDPRDAALLQAIVYGVCRQSFYLDNILQKLSDKPLELMDPFIHCLLLVGLYQLIAMRLPAYAAVDATVDAVQDLDKLWAKALVNAILRNFLRHQAEVMDLCKEYEHAHPAWLVGMIQKAYPEQAAEMMMANNQHPPMSLRVNPLCDTRAAYLEKLQARGMQATVIPETKTGITLQEPVDVLELPDFAKGAVTVQDGAAQLAAGLLDLQPGSLVLDACAAPGGKTTHILETEPSCKVIAVDLSPERLEQVHENLSRLKLQAECLAADVADLPSWWDGQAFDRILLDVPCSASGVIRRHPDIKLLRRPEDLAALTKEQLRLLTAIWPCLKIGGLLVYATCSIFPRENQGVLKRFLSDHPDARVEPISGEFGIDCEIGKQILPGMLGMDGFYYARLRKEEPVLCASNTISN